MSGPNSYFLNTTERCYQELTSSIDLSIRFSSCGKFTREIVHAMDLERKQNKIKG